MAESSRELLGYLQGQFQNTQSTDCGFPGVRIGVLLKESVAPERQYLAVHHGASHIEAYGVPATLAAGEAAVPQQGSFMHQTMRFVLDAINATEWNSITGNKLHKLKNS